MIPLRFTGEILLISVARLKAKYQNFDGNNAERSQFLAMMTADCHARSTNPFWCCRLGGALSIRIFSFSNNSFTSLPMSFLSKSVRNSFGLMPTSVRNCCTAFVKDVVRFFNGYSFLILVALSTSIRQYRIPPIAVVGPNPISICQTSLYSNGNGEGLVFLRLDFIVAWCPSSCNGVWVCLFTRVDSFPRSGIYLMMLSLL